MRQGCGRDLIYARLSWLANVQRGLSVSYLQDLFVLSLEFKLRGIVATPGSGRSFQAVDVKRALPCLDAQHSYTAS